MDKYAVFLSGRAYRDLDDIYRYIAENLQEPGVAEGIVSALEAAIFSLEQMPERGVVRRTGFYADGSYRQLVVKHYLIVYRVKKDEKEVLIATVRYAPSVF